MLCTCVATHAYMQLIMHINHAHNYVYAHVHIYIHSHDYVRM